MAALRHVTPMIAAIVAVIAIASVAENRQAEMQRSDHYWTAVTYAGTEHEFFEDAKDMFASADLVVVGRLSGMVPGRVFGEPELDDAAYYMAGALEIEEIIKGGENLRQQGLTLETFTFERSAVDHLVATYPTERGLFFLRNKGTTARLLDLAPQIVAEESKYYRLVATRGLVRDLGAGPSQIGARDEYLPELAQGSFADVVRRVRAFAQAG